MTIRNNPDDVRSALNIAKENGKAAITLEGLTGKEVVVPVDLVGPAIERR